MAYDPTTARFLDKQAEAEAAMATKPDNIDRVGSFDSPTRERFRSIVSQTGVRTVGANLDQALAAPEYTAGSGSEGGGASSSGGMSWPLILGGVAVAGGLVWYLTRDR